MLSSYDYRLVTLSIIVAGPFAGTLGIATVVLIVLGIVFVAFLARGRFAPSLANRVQHADGEQVQGTLGVSA
jgi:hypothetical protein